MFYMFYHVHMLYIRFHCDQESILTSADKPGTLGVYLVYTQAPNLTQTCNRDPTISITYTEYTSQFSLSLSHRVLSSLSPQTRRTTVPPAHSSIHSKTPTYTTLVDTYKKQARKTQESFPCIRSQTDPTPPNAEKATTCAPVYRLTL